MPLVWTHEASTWEASKPLARHREAAGNIKAEESGAERAHESKAHQKKDEKSGQDGKSEQDGKSKTAMVVALRWSAMVLLPWSATACQQAQEALRNGPPHRHAAAARCGSQSM